MSQGLWPTELDPGAAVSKRSPHLTIPIPLLYSLQTWTSVKNMGMPSAVHGGARTTWALTVVSWAAILASTGPP